MHRVRARCRIGAWVAIALIVGALAACAGPKRPAPVEDRSASAQAPKAAAATPGASDTRAPLPGAEHAGQPGYYTVKPGDTLYRIALEQGQSWRDLARWNSLPNAAVIEVGQVLRVVPPVTTAPGSTPTATAAAVPPPALESRPLDSRSAATGPGGTAPATRPEAPSAAAASATLPPPVAAPGVAATPPEDDMVWAWPASGPLLSGFDENRSKGLSIGGQAGDPVLAAADGRVVYAGSSLRGYGNLVIIKHNNTFISAYAHNQAMLVKEDQAVRRGQRIAEMGSTDADRVELHFEIRRQGKPVDPLLFLPGR